MAQAFGVSTTFIDKELASFITAGRIHAKIDKGMIPIVRVFTRRRRVFKINVVVIEKM